MLHIFYQIFWFADHQQSTWTFLKCLNCYSIPLRKSTHIVHNLIYDILDQSNYKKIRSLINFYINISLGIQDLAEEKPIQKCYPQINSTKCLKQILKFASCAFNIMDTRGTVVHVYPPLKISWTHGAQLFMFTLP